MNGRIKELVARDFPHDCNGDIMTTPESIADFAELIVRECAGIFEGIYTDQQRPERIDIRIKKHFGVEE